MRKLLYIGLVVVLALFLCACSGVNAEENITDPPANESPSIEITDNDDAVPPSEESTDDDIVSPPTEEDTDVDTIPAPEDEIPEEIEPTHSSLYLPEYTPQQIIEYFEEIVLRMEYSDGEGNTALVQKWNIPICYRIYGSPTEEDLEVLEEFFVQLNEIPGFPGIYAASDDEAENLNISFLNEEDFYSVFSTFLNGAEAYGAVQFWYGTDTNDIYTANIGYRTDIDQITRTSILFEEIVNMLGTSDTELRTDSIVYQYSNDNLALSDVDWVILKLLYNPAIQCGMDYDSCSAVIQELYY